MSKKMIVNIISCVVAVAIVATSTFFIVRHYRDKDDVVIAPTVTGGSYMVNGDVKDEVSTSETTTKVAETTTQKPTTTTTTKPQTSGTPVISTPTNPQNATPLPSDAPATDENAKKEAGLLGFMWNSEDEVFYSAKDPWQRAFGYNELYDWAAPLVVMYFDTVRIKFQYDNLDWMIQLWKGQYGFVLLGAEVGVYYKEEGSPIEHYVCEDNNNRLKVGYTCYNHGAELFERKYQDTWWLTGFVPGKLDRFADRSQMSMRIRFTLKSAEMKDAFVGGLQKCGFAQGSATAAAPDTYYASGNDVYLYWQYVAE